MLASGRIQEQLAAVCLLSDAVHASSGTTLAAHNAATVWRSPLPQQLAGVLSEDVQTKRRPMLHQATLIVELLAMLLDGRAAGMDENTILYVNKLIIGRYEARLGVLVDGPQGAATSGTMGREGKTGIESSGRGQR